MDVRMIIRDNKFSGETVNKWKTVWSSICEMAYNRNNIQEEIITRPGIIQIDEELILDATKKEHCQVYGYGGCSNIEELMLDYTWKKYSDIAGVGVMPHVVPELKHLHVPACLFYALGVQTWFAHSFPNCTVTFWET